MKIWRIIATALLAGCQNPQQDTLVDRGAYQLETLHQAQGADQRIRFLVMHYTAEDFHSSLKTLTDEHVSAHYLLPAHPQREHGKPTVYRLVPEAMRAWHAGTSTGAAAATSTTPRSASKSSTRASPAACCSPTGNPIRRSRSPC